MRIEYKLVPTVSISTSLSKLDSRAILKELDNSYQTRNKGLYGIYRAIEATTMFYVNIIFRENGIVNINPS